MAKKIFPYNPALKQLARQLRNSSTKSEIRLWLRLKDKQVHGFDFHRQKPIDRFICDFFCNDLMLAIELDGLTHNWEEVIEKDRLKENRLAELGITVLRFNDKDVMNDMENVLRVIGAWIENKIHTPGTAE